MICWYLQVDFVHDLIDFQFLWLSFCLQHFQIVNHPLHSPNHQFYSYFSFVSLSPFLLFSIHNFIQFLSFFIRFSIFSSSVFQWFLPDFLFHCLEQISGFPFLLFLFRKFLFWNPIFESVLLNAFVGSKSFGWFILFGWSGLRILFVGLFCLPATIINFIKDLKNQN